MVNATPARLAALEDVLVTGELDRRPPRPADCALENRALAALADSLARGADGLLQSLAEQVVECCRAESAGISILEGGDPGAGDASQSRFRWAAVAGAFATHTGSSLPHALAPCRMVIERDEPLLLDRPARYFHPLRAADPAIAEALLVPFHCEGRPVGTVWALTHEGARRFDREDARVLESLARFAAAGHQLTGALHDARAARDALEQRVHERTLALERACAEQQNLTARLRSFANQLTEAEHRERKRIAGVLHDNVQQLLVASRMQLRRAETNAPAAAEARREAASLIDEALDATRTLTDKLRPPVLYEAGFMAALDWLAQEMRRQQDLKVHIVSHLGDPAPSLSDEINVMLFESVRELLFNAGKYAGVSDVAVEVRVDDARLAVAVADEGQGFDVAQAQVGHGGGVGGFGLFSVRERLAALGGDMTVDSTPRRGTRITLEVPLPHPTAAAETGHGATDAGAGVPEAPLRVLVVDDHAVVRQSIASALESDARVTVVGQADDGEAAVDAVEHVRPDVVLMDINMPRLSGLDATRQICARWPRVVVLGLSVEEEPDAVVAMRESGAAALISKSSDLNGMVASIARHAAPYTA